MILDTNAVSALLSGDNQIMRVLQQSDYHHLPLIVIGEYRFGILLSRKQRQLQSLWEKLESNSILLAADRSTCDWYASVRYELKKKGRPIPENDIWIAALALQHELQIVSNDSHFDHIENIERLGW